MNDVKELLNRVVDEVIRQGHEDQIGVINRSVYKYEVGKVLEGRFIDIEETERRNHSDLDNVTVTISVYDHHAHCGKFVGKTKVPANASDKVIENRVKNIFCTYWS